MQKTKTKKIDPDLAFINAGKASKQYGTPKTIKETDEKFTQWMKVATDRFMREDVEIKTQTKNMKEDFDLTSEAVFALDNRLQKVEASKNIMYIISMINLAMLVAVFAKTFLLSRLL